MIYLRRIRKCTWPTITCDAVTAAQHMLWPCDHPSDHLSVQVRVLSRWV